MHQSPSITQSIELGHINRLERRVAHRLDARHVVLVFQVLVGLVLGASFVDKSLITTDMIGKEINVRLQSQRQPQVARLCGRGH
jgi:hypothetical protein